jgi:hypothetical protein
MALWRPRFFHPSGRRSTGIPKFWPRAVEAHLRPRFFLPSVPNFVPLALCKADAWSARC